jgi:hypothetical protein
MIKKHDRKFLQVYDIECYPNFFAVGLKNPETGERKTFRIWADSGDQSQFINEYEELVDYLLYKVKRLIGYNNFDYDDILINYVIYERKRLTNADPLKICEELKGISNNCINIQRKLVDNSVKMAIRKYKNCKYIPSTDLLQIFNRIDRISLKQMGVNMKWPNIIDLPLPENKYLTREEMERVSAYLDNDVDITEAVLNLQKDELKLRVGITKRTKVDVTNSCRTDIAKKVIMNFLIKETGKAESEIKKGRTFYETIALKDCVSPKVRLITKEGQRLLKAIENKVIDPNKKESAGKKKKQFEYIYKSKYVSHTIGLGGIHSNNPPEILEENDQYIYLDIDATSYYPYLIVEENYFPAHIGPIFVPIYKNNVLIPRVEAKAKSKIDPLFKIDAETLKIVANGTFGLTKSVHDYLYDPVVTTKTCINGELFLVMLIEWIEEFTSAMIVYSNTDGLTIRIPVNEYAKVMKICQQWEYYTNMTLEYTRYSKMVLLNVNNYLIIKDDGEVKVKGSVFNNKIELTKGYEYPIMSKALFDFYTKQIPVEETIRACTDIYEFMKSQRTDIEISDVVIKRKDGSWEKLQKTNRWVVTKNGNAEGRLYKRDKSDNSLEELQKGYLVTIVNRVDSDLPFENYKINYDFYINGCLTIINTIRKNYTDSHTKDMTEQLELKF